MSDTRKLQAPDAPFFGSTSPTTAGFLRGAVYAVATAAVGALTVYFTEVDAGELAIFAPIAVVVLNTIGGIIDDRSTRG